MPGVSCFIVMEQHALVVGDGQFSAILQLLTVSETGQWLLGLFDRHPVNH